MSKKSNQRQSELIIQPLLYIIDHAVVYKGGRGKIRTKDTKIIGKREKFRR